MEKRELIIKTNKDLLSNINRKDVTKLILGNKINKNLLFGFTNVKELEISFDEAIDTSINENNINSFPFFDKLEKITYKNISFLGHRYIKKSNDYLPFRLKNNNVKSIELKYDDVFSSTKRYANPNSNYFIYCKKLEEIVFDFSGDIYLNKPLYIPSSVKKIIFRVFGKEFIIPLENFEYNSFMCSFRKNINEINVDIYSDKVVSHVKIDVIREKIIIENELRRLNNSMIDKECLYISDFIHVVNYNTICNTLKVKHVSFNNLLLKNKIYQKKYFIDKNYLDLLETITIRYNNDMSLFPNKVINVKEYGELNDAYIYDGELRLVYEDKIVRIDDKGTLNIESIIIKTSNDKKEELKNKKVEFNLDKYSINELEDYLQYRKLLERYKNNKDQELVDAVNIIGKKLLKKINKGDYND